MKKFTSEEIKEFVSKPLFDEKGILNKDPSWPRISIVTPSYNQAQFLEKTILSVLNQNYPNLEYIIIDGGSTDGSMEIIKKYEKYLAYWVNEKDNGQADAIEKGFRKCSGEILAYINSDDTYLSGAFLKVAETFQKSPKANLVYGNIYFIDEKNNKLNELRLTKMGFKNLIFENICLAQPATFWKRSIYDQVGGFNIDYHYSMDLDFFIRVAKIGHLIYLPEHLANFRVHKESKTIIETGAKKMSKWQAENKKIKEQFLSLKTNKIYFIFMKKMCQLQRIFNYFKQGDAKYVLKKIASRIKGITFQDEMYFSQKRTGEK